ncbi:MAG: 16S rRNA (guanine(966)-N(2))-methyltransferase RsmD [Porticoccaceae bacterium]
MRKKTAQESQSSIRIIGGKWRSRRLNFQTAEGLRPTGDRIRETLFNWLAPDIQGARCLDLFAGSGALSFEALSRGACRCTAIDNNPAVIAQLRANQSDLGAEDLQLVQGDARDYLTHRQPDTPFDIVFMDPPFARDLHAEISLLLVQNCWLADSALIYCEMPATEPDLSGQYWRSVKQKTAGAVRYCLYSQIEISA